MNYKDELIAEISDNVEYYEVLNILDMKDDVDFEFDKYLDNLSDKKLIKMFNDYCYNYNEFLRDHEMGDMI